MYGFLHSTEAGSVGTFAVLLLSVIKRDIGFKGYIKSVIRVPSHGLHGPHVDCRVKRSSVIFLREQRFPMIAADWM